VAGRRHPPPVPRELTATIPMRSARRGFECGRYGVRGVSGVGSCPAGAPPRDRKRLRQHPAPAEDHAARPCRAGWWYLRSRSGRSSAALLRRVRKMAGGGLSKSPQMALMSPGGAVAATRRLERSPGKELPSRSVRPSAAGGSVGGGASIGSGRRHLPGLPETNATPAAARHPHCALRAAGRRSRTGTPGNGAARGPGPAALPDRPRPAADRGHRPPGARTLPPAGAAPPHGR